MTDPRAPIWRKTGQGLAQAVIGDAAAADHRPAVAQVVGDVVLRCVFSRTGISRQLVGDVVLRCICSRTGVSRQLAVRGQDVGDGELVRCQRRSDPTRKNRLNYL